MTATYYNVRIIDNHDGSFSLGFVSRLKLNRDGGGGGEWKDGSLRKMKKLLRSKLKESK